MVILGVSAFKPLSQLILPPQLSMLIASMNTLENAFLRSGLWVAEHLKHRNRNPDVARRPSPPKLLSQKRRSLSLSSDSSSPNTHYLQSQSLLFARLPPEIRAHIFAYVVGGHQHHLLLTYMDDGNLHPTTTSLDNGSAVIHLLLSLPRTCRRA